MSKQTLSQEKIELLAQSLIDWAKEEEAAEAPLQVETTSSFDDFCFPSSFDSADWEKSGHKPTAHVRLEGDSFVLLGKYRIQANQVDTHEKLASLLYYFLGKRWIPSIALEQFIEAVCEYHGLTLHKVG